MTNRRRPGAIAIIAALALSLGSTSPVLADPFKLGVEQKGYVQDPYQGEAAYPEPEYVQPTQPLQGNVQARPPKALSAGAMTQKSVPLPAGFLGTWLVDGQRTKVEAQNPAFQQGAAQAFATQTRNTWTIGGNPGKGYTFTNDMGVKSSIFIQDVKGDTAFIKYQHPVKNTMAQEAVVMSLQAGGARFSGLERISIVKQGEGVRAKVTYQLSGQRKR
ncbi:MAG: hypothetical protein K8F91_04690 [Candidatus Obscuribacterales bacterium]|nr:hypothetical protein [Candidatus Obscuribacterales bacterium]